MVQDRSGRFWMIQDDLRWHLKLIYKQHPLELDLLDD